MIDFFLWDTCFFAVLLGCGECGGTAVSTHHYVSKVSSLLMPVLIGFEYIFVRRTVNCSCYLIRFNFIGFCFLCHVIINLDISLCELDVLTRLARGRLLCSVAGLADNSFDAVFAGQRWWGGVELTSLCIRNSTTASKDLLQYVYFIWYDEIKCSLLGHLHHIVYSRW